MCFVGVFAPGSPAKGRAFEGSPRFQAGSLVRVAAIGLAKGERRNTKAIFFWGRTHLPYVSLGPLKAVAQK